MKPSFSNASWIFTSKEQRAISSFTGCFVYFVDLTINYCCLLRLPSAKFSCFLWLFWSKFECASSKAKAEMGAIFSSLIVQVDFSPDSSIWDVWFTIMDISNKSWKHPSARILITSASVIKDVLRFVNSSFFFSCFFSFSFLNDPQVDSKCVLSPRHPSQHDPVLATLPHFSIYWYHAVMPTCDS